MARIFVYEDGTPISFHVSEGQDASKIVKLIKENGGAITVAADANFRLQFDVHSHTAITLRSLVVNATWIADCCRVGTKLPIFRYQFNPTKLDMLEEPNRSRAEIIKEVANSYTMEMYALLHRRLPHLTSHQWRNLHMSYSQSNYLIIEAHRKLAASIQAEITSFQADAAVRLEEGILSLIVDNLSTGVSNETPSQIVSPPTLEPTETIHVSPAENTMGGQPTDAARSPQPIVPPDEDKEVIPAMAQFAINAGLVKDNTLTAPTLVQLGEFMTLYDKDAKRTPNIWQSAWHREVEGIRLMPEIQRILRVTKPNQAGGALGDDKRPAADHPTLAQPYTRPPKRKNAKFSQMDVEAVARFLRAPGKESLVENIRSKGPSRKHWREFIETDIYRRASRRSENAWDAFYRKYRTKIIEAANKIPK